MDRFWRRLAPLVWLRLGLRGIATGAKAEQAAMRRLDRLVSLVARHHGPQGALARAWPTGSTVVWIGALLALYLVLFTL